MLTRSFGNTSRLCWHNSVFEAVACVRHVERAGVVAVVLFVCLGSVAMRALDLDAFVVACLLR